MCSWYSHDGLQGDVILSSRVRLARNLNNYKFINKINSDDSKKVVDEVKDTILNGSSYLAEQFKYIDINEINESDKISLLDTHLISKELLKQRNILSGALISKDETISIMINEEDHIRIQSIFPGFQLKDAWELSNKVDNLLEERIEFAFDENIGYLTSCPTNVGTGMRASVMLHLPALSMIGYIDGLLSALSKIGITTRGLYGEGSQALGYIFQISNQITLGQSEEDILENLNGVILQVIEKEREARQNIFKQSKLKLTDRIYRAYGILTNARILSSNECISLLSDIRLGINLGILCDINMSKLNELLVTIQSPNIRRLANNSEDENNINFQRAEYVREKLSEKEKK